MNIEWDKKYHVIKQNFDDKMREFTTCLKKCQEISAIIATPVVDNQENDGKIERAQDELFRTENQESDDDFDDIEWEEGARENVQKREEKSSTSAAPFDRSRIEEIVKEIGLDSTMYTLNLDIDLVPDLSKNDLQCLRPMLRDLCLEVKNSHIPVLDDWLNTLLNPHRQSPTESSSSDSPSPIQITMRGMIGGRLYTYSESLLRVKSEMSEIYSKFSNTLSSLE